MAAQHMTIEQYLAAFEVEWPGQHSVAVVYNSTYAQGDHVRSVFRIVRDAEGRVALCDHRTTPREVGDEPSMTLETAASVIRDVLTAWGYLNVDDIDADAVYDGVDLADYRHVGDAEE